MDQATKFEKPRGVSGITVRHGFAQAHVSGWETDIPEKRLDVLRLMADAGISIDFLKMTPSGMSFLAPADRADKVEEVLQSLEAKYSLRKPCSVILAHAVNIRDEEGLVARIMKAAIEGDFRVHHISDMHDRAILVVDSDEAGRLTHTLESSVMEVAHAR